MNGDSLNKKFYGKYRGTVLNNVDPEQRGRLMAMVPDVLAENPSSWAEPCVPLAGPTGHPMGVYLVPPISAGVWIEFEQGDSSRPIWSGCRWGVQARRKSGPTFQQSKNLFLPENGIATLRCFTANCLYGGRNRLQIAV